MATNAHALAAGALGIALGLAAAALWPDADRTPAPPAGSTGDADGRASLAAALAAEQEARAALEAENAALRAALAGTQPAPGQEPSAGPVTGAGPDAAAAAGPRADPDPAATPIAPGAAPAREAFDAVALAALGLPDAEIERLRERYAAHQLDELYLRDEARRDGWLRDPRYQRELRGLRGALRDELGDAGYDTLLYATGQHNRVVITQPIPGSPAERAGLQAGDALLSYGGERIFDAIALIQATAARPAGEQTELRFERNGEELRAFLPRGPLGTTLRPDRRPPDTR
jgi:hypothetical protein